MNMPLQKAGKSRGPMLASSVLFCLLATACLAPSPAAAACAANMFGWFLDVSGQVAMLGAPGAGTGLIQETGKVEVYRQDDGVWRLGQTILPRADALRFGYSLRMHGSTAAIGAPDSPAGGSTRGEVYLYELIAGSWRQSQIITASDRHDTARFGEAVAIYGDTLVVGSPFAPSGGVKRGQAYIFERQEGVWVETQVLRAGLPADMAWYGFYVAISDDTIMIGQPQGTRQAQPGRVYVYEKDDGRWQLTQILTAGDRSAFDGFGMAFDLEADRALIGSPYSPSGGSERGQVYAFERLDGAWQQTQILAANPQHDQDGFGMAVNLDGATAVLGAPWGDGGVNDQGAAYVYNLDDGLWLQNQVLRPDDPSANGWFGQAVGISGTTAFIGAPGALKSALAGSVYRYLREAGAWLGRASYTSDDCTPSPRSHGNP